MNVKVIIGLCVMMCFVFCSCSQDDIVYSCDKEVNAWAKENLSDIQQMNRAEWLNLDENLKGGAYAASEKTCNCNTTSMYICESIAYCKADCNKTWIGCGFLLAHSCDGVCSLLGT